MISSSSSDVQLCGQPAGRIAVSVPGSPSAARAANHCSSTRTPPTSKSHAPGGTGEMRPSSRNRASSSRS